MMVRATTTRLATFRAGLAGFAPPERRALGVCFFRRIMLYYAAKIIFMSTKVETKTRELCEAILEHLETGGIKKRIDTFLADTSARGQYESLMSKGQTLQEKQHGGQALEPAEISAFETDRDALLKNPVASAFLDAQEEMHDLQHLVQKHVNKTIELGRVPGAEDLESSCGHGGCGCHSH
jgi:cell fate (sporulation/competence/biofilm development) regulator YlbF (YheA/YmcA/DUF963 family)